MPRARWCTSARCPHPTGSLLSVLGFLALYAYRYPHTRQPRSCSDIRSVVEGPPLQLLEAVAHRGADLVLRRHPRVRAVRLGVRKLCIPGLHSVVDSVGVEVMRRRHPG